MKRKNISKFAILSSFLIVTTTANSFYQCVPKKEWIYETVKEYYECPAGHGKGNSLNCVKCSSGTYSPDGKGCKSCPAGTYASGSGNIKCTACSGDTYQPNSGQSSCLSCNRNDCKKVSKDKTSWVSTCEEWNSCNGAGECGFYSNDDCKIYSERFCWRRTVDKGDEYFECYKPHYDFVKKKCVQCIYDPNPAFKNHCKDTHGGVCNSEGMCVKEENCGETDRFKNKNDEKIDIQPARPYP